MEAKNFYIMLVNKAQNLKDTQIFGKQSPCVTLSIGKSVQERASTTTKDRAGCYCVWDETIYIEINNNIEFLLVEVKSGSDLIGLGRIAASHVSEFPRTLDLQLTDRGGKKAGKLTCSIQKYYGDLNQVHSHAHSLQLGQAHASAAPAANMFLNSINRAPTGQAGNTTGVQQHGGYQGGGFQQPVAHSGGFQQPMTAGGYQQNSGKSCQGEQIYLC